MSPTWRDKFITEQSSLELEYEEAAQLPMNPCACGAPSPRGYGHRCGRPRGHEGDHMVVHYKSGPQRGLLWRQEEL
jgi:hypothetical protein